MILYIEFFSSFGLNRLFFNLHLIDAEKHNSYAILEVISNNLAQSGLANIAASQSIVHALIFAFSA
jgi:hypothetical protein